MWDINLQKNKKGDLPDPIGFNKSFDDVQGNDRQQDVKNKAWSIATSGFSNIFMTLFMMYMSGSGMNIFTILITCSFIMQPIQNIMKVGQAFAPYQNKKVFLLHYQFIYLSIHLFIFSIGLYKLYTIGLLPLNSADWIDMVPYHKQDETIIAYNLN